MTRKKQITFVRFGRNRPQTRLLNFTDEISVLIGKRLEPDVKGIEIRGNRHSTQNSKCVVQSVNTLSARVHRTENFLP